MRSTNGSSCWWRRLLVSLCVQTREQARHVRPPKDGFACAFACTANKLNLVLSLLLTVVVCDGQTKWHGPHGLSELPQTKENEHRSPSDKGSEQTQKKSEGTHSGDMGAVTRWPRTPPFLSKAARASPTRSLATSFATTARTSSFTSRSVSRSTRSISLVLDLPNTCTTLGAAGCNTSS
ncbi:unnamed protein product [Ectocarpus sp. 12 AP-2014]